jgi:hypothetical protein
MAEENPLILEISDVRTTSRSLFPEQGEAKRGRYTVNPII